MIRATAGRYGLLSIGVLALLVLAGGASAGVDLKQATHRSQLITINVQDVAGIPYNYLQLGIYQGFFKRHGLDVKAQAAAGGAVIVPAIINGSVQFGGSNVVSSMLAASRGLPIRMVAPGTFGGPKAPDWAAIIVRRDSPIRAVKDLEGKTIAANTLRNVVELTSKAALDKRGVAASTLKYTEIDFPQMHDALVAGRVDAAFLIEPFLYEAVKAGDRVIAYPYHGTAPGMQIGSYLARADYVEQHPRIVENFQKSLQDLSLWIAKHPKATRKFLTAAAGIPQSTAQNIVLPTWKTSVSFPSLRTTSSLMVKYGLLTSQVDPATFVIASPPVKKK